MIRGEEEETEKGFREKTASKISQNVPNCILSNESNVPRVFHNDYSSVAMFTNLSPIGLLQLSVFHIEKVTSERPAFSKLKFQECTLSLLFVLKYADKINKIALAPYGLFHIQKSLLIATIDFKIHVACAIRLCDYLEERKSAKPS